MRPVLVVALLAVVPTYADTPQPGPGPAPKAAPAAVPKVAPAPDPKGQPRTLPPAAVQDGILNAADAAGGTGALAMDGGRAAGVVIEPPVHPDARAWPEGIWMTPPEVRDRMLIAPGTNAMSSELRAVTSWGKRLADAVVERAGKLVELMLPRSL